MGAKVANDSTLHETANVMQPPKFENTHGDRIPRDCIQTYIFL